MPVESMNLKVQSDVGSATKDISVGDQTAFSGQTVLGQDEMLDSWEAGGSDKKSIKSSVGSGSNSNSVSIDSSGPGSASVSSVASSDAVVSCFDGKMAGDTALVELASESNGNNQYLTAGFSGEASDTEGLDASLTMVAAGSSGIDGDLSLMGVDGLGAGVSGNMAMELNGLYVKSDGRGLGQFGAAHVNVDKRAAGKVSKARIVKGKYDNYNDPTAWVAAGWRWQNNPDIQFYLRADGNMADEGMTADQAKAAISAAAELWDGQTNQNLFSDGVIAEGTMTADKLDGVNVHAWIPMASDALAYSRTYYYTTKYVYGPNGKRYKKAIESDVSYNTKFAWTADITNLDLYPATNTFNLQTVATHEMGHTLGLGDTYLNSLYKYDLAQIMGYYNDANDLYNDGKAEVDLGAGDIKGITTLYGQ